MQQWIAEINSYYENYTNIVKYDGEYISYPNLT